MDAGRRTTAIWLAAITVLAFLVRLGMTLYFQGLDSPPDPNLGPDHLLYNLHAEALVRGEGYTEAGRPTAYKPPGTSFLLAGVYTMFGIDYRAAHLLMCLLGALTCPLVYRVARRGMPRNAALAASALLALDPGHAYYSMHFFSETPWGFFFMASLVLLDAGLAGGRWWWAALAGVAMGWATLIRPVSLLYPAALGGLWALGFAVDPRGRAWRARWLALVVLGLGMVLGIGGWTLRNYHALNRPVLVSTHGGVTFYGANNAVILTNRSEIGHWIYSGELLATLALTNTTDPVAVDAQLYRAGQVFLATHWRSIPRLEAWKLYRLFAAFPRTPNLLFNRVVGWFSWPLLVLALAGLVYSARRGAWIAFTPLLAGLLAMVGNTLVFYGDHRFRIAMDPVFVIYAVYGALALWAWARPRMCSR